MELEARSQSIAEVKQRNKHLIWAVLGLTVAVVLLASRIATQSAIVVLQTPGMPSSAEIEESAVDKGTQMATLITLTSSIAQINPANAAFMKRVIQNYLLPEAYTEVSAEIDAKVRQLELQHELGSYYFVFKSYRYDPVLRRHFILGDVHTVNAARDTPEPYVFEYRIQVMNYRLWAAKPIVYPGDRPHDSEWLKSNEATNTQATQRAAQ